MKKQYVPSFVSYLFYNVVILWLILFVARFSFAYFFLPKIAIPLKSWVLGSRFDLKLVAIVFLPLAFVLYLKRSTFFKKPLWKIIGKWYLWVAYLLVSTFYILDAGYYQYLNTRVDSGILRFADQSVFTYLRILWESYPVVGILLGVVLFFYLLNKLLDWGYHRSAKVDFPRSRNLSFGLLSFFLLSFSIYNSVTHFPLRWSEAFFSKDQRINQFTTNPVLYFFQTFTGEENRFDLERTKAYYPALARELHLDKEALHFARDVCFSDTLSQRPNVVIVLLESLGASVMSHFGNPIKTTPKIDSIANESLFFTNFFVHKVGTAPSVFASITGLPDVVIGTTASRTPLIIDQRILFDQYDGYEKFFFIASSANWANIRGVLGSNIEGLQIYEEGSYEVEDRVDVWGIDDYELFKEADKVLAKQQKPFVAYIETASNHMPFTYPDQKESFRSLRMDELESSVMKASGFRSLKQLNALRYLDFNVNRFLERTKKSGYYDNTIFVFFGDHNTWVNEFDFTPLREYELGIQSHHVPAFIHAPKYVHPLHYKPFAKLIDLFPTATCLARQSHTNYTLGVNLLGDKVANSAFLYTKLQGEYAVGLLKDQYYYLKSLQSDRTALYHLDRPKENLNNIPLVKSQMDSLATGFYESTRYLYFNNQKK